MSEHGVITEAGSVRFERMLPGPIERVWAFLTESEKRRRWLASGDMKDGAGGTVTLRFRNGELSSQHETPPEKYKEMSDVSFSARILRCQPPRLLTMTWGGEDGPSEVTFELTPEGAEVRLVLTHRRLPGREAMLMVAGGWHAHLAILADVLRGAEPRPFWSTHARLEAEYERRLPR